MYCGIEGSIMAYAVHEYVPFIPVWALMVFFGLAVIPLNWFGIKQLDKLQKWTMPIFIFFILFGFFMLAKETTFTGNIWAFLPEGVEVGGTSLLACIGIMNGFTNLRLCSLHQAI